MTIPGLALLIIVVAFAEVAYRKVSGRTGLPWMRDPEAESEGRGAAAIGFETFGSVFDPGKKHEFEQRQTVLMHRENPGDGDGGIDVDLTAGKVKIRKL
ncbi:hypothetical protein GFY24_26900 [Nocardia sp. SYP-A9097]|nr:hypothetical protein [Nocardia sp. SYP-A9097]